MEKQQLGQVPKKRTSKQQLLQLVEEEEEEQEQEEEEEDEETFADLHPNDFQFAQWVVESFPQYRAACIELGTNLWESIMNVARFIILARTPAVSVALLNENKLEYAQQLCARHDGDQQKFAIVWDGLATEYSQRFVAQNACSVGFFGSVLDGAARWPIIEETEITRVVRAGLWMVHNFGKEYSLPALQMRCVDGVIRKFNAALWLDPNTYFYAVLSGTILYE